jgi:hypothetical protein
MMARRYPEDVYQTLKAAYRRLIELAGGLEAAAGITRINKTTLGVCAQPGKDFHLPGDVIIDLEKEVGEPLVTRFLAMKAGYELLPLAGRGPSATIDPTHMIVRLARKVGDFAKSVEDMDEDGVREPHELRRCIAEMTDVVDGAQCCLTMLQVQLTDLTTDKRG